jgi:hypothetical protein
LEAVLPTLGGPAVAGRLHVLVSREASSATTVLAGAWADDSDDEMPSLVGSSDTEHDEVAPIRPTAAETYDQDVSRLAT